MHFFKELVEMRKSSRDIFHHQGIGHYFSAVGGLTRRLLSAVAVSLRKCIVICFESFENLSIDPLFVSD
jgi:hypothetical protein|tara:strand:- start:2065 stop:2271 length:207 start_codon:yes stop_codon:yes gene_type:complete